MKSNYTVYVHTFPNGKKYVGVTRTNPTRRWGCNGQCYKQKHQPLIFNAIMKYGWDNVTHEIVAEGLSQAEASTKEVELVRELQSHMSEGGYNMSWGGVASALIVSAESRRKMSEARKGFKPSLESRRKMSEAKRGKGGSMSIEHKQKIAMANSNPSKEKRRKMSEARKGKPMSDCTKKRIAEANTNKVVSEETRRKMSEAQRRRRQQNTLSS